MKTMLACAGVNGDEKALAKLVKAAAEKKPEGILFAGGVTAFGSKGPERARFIGKFFDSLSKVGCYVAVIPGPQDAPLYEFLREAVNTEISHSNISIVHAGMVARGDVLISGIGGQITETEDMGSPLIKCSHAAAEYFLRSFAQAAKPVKILMLSEPPPGALAGNAGNAIVREILNTVHPNFAVVAGGTPCRGVEQEKHTLTVSPGCLAEGSAAWIDRLARKANMLDI